MKASYDGRQVVGIDLPRRRTVIVRMTGDGWCVAADVLQDEGAEVHLAHPPGVKAFTLRR